VIARAIGFGSSKPDFLGGRDVLLLLLAADRAADQSRERSAAGGCVRLSPSARASLERREHFLVPARSMSIVG
jgi:hypothetical protein